MIRERSAVTIFGVAVLVVSLIYLFAPQDPISGTIQRIVFGIDNRFSDVGLAIDNGNEKIDQLNSDIARLQQDLNFVKDSQLKLVGAKVVAKSVQNYRSFIDVNIGQDDGVEKGAAVIGQGRLIGRIDQVFSNRSRIITIEDPDFRAAAIIEGTKIDGLVRSVPGGIVIEQIGNQNAANFKTEQVVTSGLGGLYPPGLYIGKLDDRINDETAIFAEFSLSRTAHIGSIEEVYVLLP